MTDVQHMSLIYKSSKPLKILDQCQLPHKEVWLKCDSLEVMEDAIKRLKVRGAPMIGLSSNFFLAFLAQKKTSVEDLMKASEVLKKSRPTAVNLIHYMNDFQKILKATKESSWIEKWAYEKWIEDESASDKMSTFGTTLLNPGMRVLTHCNTGGLAAARGGTALGVFFKAFEVFGNLHVYVDETRPLLQGARLTTWELSKKKVPYTLICDNMAGSLMAANKVDAVFVGADRIASNGDSANKIGTYPLAVLAHYHNIPFYIVAPTKTIDSSLESGKGIPVEQRKEKEVQGFVHPNQEIQWAPACEVYNPAFDVTPASLISAWITEEGIFRQKDIDKGVFKKCGH